HLMTSTRRLQDPVFAPASRWAMQHHVGSMGRSKLTSSICRHLLLVQSDCSRNPRGKTLHGVGRMSRLDPASSARSRAGLHSKLRERTSCRNWRYVNSMLHYGSQTMNYPWKTLRETWRVAASPEEFCSGTPTMV